jgi:hypothetical protein
VLFTIMLIIGHTMSTKEKLMPDHGSDLDEQVLDAILGKKFKTCRACRGEGKVKVVRTIEDPNGEKEEEEEDTSSIGSHVALALASVLLTALMFYLPKCF